MEIRLLLFYFVNNFLKYSTCATQSRFIVIINSRFLQCPQKQSRRNQLIHRHFSYTKSIGSGSDPESQANSQTVMVDGVWSWEGEGDIIGCP